jgi:hypothetical protein
VVADPVGDDADRIAGFAPGSAIMDRAVVCIEVHEDCLRVGADQVALSSGAADVRATPA